ncbi:MAG: hypothetical protein AVDCRST_MAG64-51, partial [uncultured Phycisphaerae bacterium]
PDRRAVRDRPQAAPAVGRRPAPGRRRAGGGHPVPVPAGQRDRPPLLPGVPAPPADPRDHGRLQHHDDAGREPQPAEGAEPGRPVRGRGDGGQGVEHPADRL